MKDLLNDAKHEIIALRRRNEVLQAKVDTMDLFALVLRTPPIYNGQAMSPDVVWALEKAINALVPAQPPASNEFVADGCEQFAKPTQTAI